MIQEYDGLLRAVCERPGDDGVRLVMADWLEDAGDWEQATFIRGQLGDEEAKRDWAKIVEIGEPITWGPVALFPEQACRWGWEYHRGFCGAVGMPAADFTEAVAGKLFTVWPLTSVTLLDRRPFGRAYLGRDRFRRWWLRAEGEACHESRIQEWVWAHLGDLSLGTAKGQYTSEKDAFQDLNRACVKAGRRLVGLPDLTGVGGSG